MRFWPFKRKRLLPESQPSAEAREALRQAQRGLVDAERLDCAVRDVTERLSQRRERNHFAAAVNRRLRGV
jgi:hypothetical protein